MVFNLEVYLVMCEIVSFEIAKKLKEKGFYYKCFATYDKDGMLGYNYVQPEKPCAIGFDDCLCANNIENNGCIDAPTISQVLKWLRDKHAIHITIGMHSFGWYYMVVVYKYYEEDGKYRLKPVDLSFKCNGSYEEAALAGIEYTLDNLI